MTDGNKKERKKRQQELLAKDVISKTERQFSGAVEDAVALRSEIIQNL